MLEIWIEDGLVVCIESFTVKLGFLEACGRAVSLNEMSMDSDLPLLEDELECFVAELFIKLFTEEEIELVILLEVVELLEISGIEFVIDAL